MQSPFQKIIIGSVFFSITIVIAIFGYTLFGWTLLESAYMVVITIFGVGYGEVQPLETATEKIFTIVVIIAGTSSAIYGVGAFIQMITQGEINRAFEAEKKRKTIASLESHIIICGFGHIGQVLAQKLAEVPECFLIIDHDLENITTAQNRGYLVQPGDAADENVLQLAGIKKAKILATVLPSDATNVFITLTARELNPDLIILARGELPSTEKKLRLAGANHVVLPASVSGARIANLITAPSIVDFLEHQEEQTYLKDLLLQIKVQIEELVVSHRSRLVGKTVRELEIRGKGAFIVVALRRGDGQFISHPHPSLLLNSGDTLIVLGHQEDLPQFARFYQLNHRINHQGA